MTRPARRPPPALRWPALHGGACLRTLAAAVLVALGLSGLPPTGARAGEPAADEAAPGRLVVHEWGTFTCVQGADGMVLEGLQHEEETLPDFVYSRAKVRTCPLRERGFKGLEVPAEHVTQKMETPVLYFHTDTPRRLRVRVDFVDGLITQWYPVSDLLGPPEAACEEGPLDLATVERSFLQWDVELLPGASRPAQVPAVVPYDPWAHARDVDAAWVRTLPREGPGRAGPVEAERFLFYRGLGTFTLPFRVGVSEEGVVSFRNGSEHQVDQVVALEVGPDGTVGRYDIRCYVAAGETAAGLLADRETWAWKDDGVEGLRADMAKILRGQGMNADEARAMVRTWTRSWFLTEGLRVFYVVPRPLVDVLLPLHVDPAPDRIERALVGRIECIAPAGQAEVEAALRVLAGSDAQDPPAPARVRAAKERLGRLGRFREAWLRRVLATSEEASVRAMAEALLPAAGPPAVDEGPR